MSQRVALCVPKATWFRSSGTGCRQPLLQTLRLLFLLSISLFWSPVAMMALHLRVEPLPEKINDTQTVTLAVTLEWPQTEGPYEIQAPEPALENLVLLRQGQLQESGPLTTYSIIYEFRPIKKGQATIASFEIRYRLASAQTWEVLSVPKQRFNVVASFPFKIILLMMIVLAGTVGILWLAFLMIKGIRVRKALAKQLPPDPKQKIFTHAAEMIATFASPDAKEKLQHWSMEFKTVILTYYSLSPAVASEAQILDILKTRNLPAGEWNEISRIFAQLSQMKFAKLDLSSQELEQLQKTLLQYVRGKIIIENSNPAS